jgi:hypothetical protein
MKRSMLLLAMAALWPAAAEAEFLKIRQNVFGMD